MGATVHALPVRPHAHVSRAEYDSHDREWILTVTDDPNVRGYAPPTSVPAHILAALADFAS